MHFRRLISQRRPQSGKVPFFDFASLARHFLLRRGVLFTRTGCSLRRSKILCAEFLVSLREAHVFIAILSAGHFQAKSDMTLDEVLEPFRNERGV